MAILEAPCAQNALRRSTMRPPEALLPRNPTWESSHFSGPTMNRLANQVSTNGRFFIPLKTLTSLNKEVGPFSQATIAFGVVPLFLPLAITAFGGPEGYFSLAIIALGAFQFNVPKYYYRLGKMEFKGSSLLNLRRLRSSRTELVLRRNYHQSFVQPDFRAEKKALPGGFSACFPVFQAEKGPKKICTKPWLPVIRA